MGLVSSTPSCKMSPATEKKEGIDLLIEWLEAKQKIDGQRSELLAYAAAVRDEERTEGKAIKQRTNFHE
jgi:hypothetical protein